MITIFIKHKRLYSKILIMLRMGNQFSIFKNQIEKEIDCDHFYIVIITSQSK